MPKKSWEPSIDTWIDVLPKVSVYRQQLQLAIQKASDQMDARETVDIKSILDRFERDLKWVIEHPTVQNDPKKYAQLIKAYTSNIEEGIRDISKIDRKEVIAFRNQVRENNPGLAIWDDKMYLLALINVHLYRNYLVQGTAIRMAYLDVETIWSKTPWSEKVTIQKTYPTENLKRMRNTLWVLDREFGLQILPQFETALAAGKASDIVFWVAGRVMRDMKNGTENREKRQEAMLKYTQAFQEFDGINKDSEKFRVLTQSMLDTKLDTKPSPNSLSSQKRWLPEADSMESILAFVESQLVIQGFDSNELNMMQNILESFIPIHGELNQIRIDANELLKNYTINWDKVTILKRVMAGIGIILWVLGLFTGLSNLKKIGNIKKLLEAMRMKRIQKTQTLSVEDGKSLYKEENSGWSDRATRYVRTMRHDRPLDYTDPARKDISNLLEHEYPDISSDIRKSWASQFSMYLKGNPEALSDYNRLQIDFKKTWSHSNFNSGLKWLYDNWKRSKSLDRASTVDRRGIIEDTLRDNNNIRASSFPTQIRALDNPQFVSILRAEYITHRENAINTLERIALESREVQDTILSSPEKMKAYIEATRSMSRADIANIEKMRWNIRDFDNLMEKLDEKKWNRSLQSLLSELDGLQKKGWVELDTYASMLKKRKMIIEKYRTSLLDGAPENTVLSKEKQKLLQEFSVRRLEEMKQEIFLRWAKVDKVFWTDAYGQIRNMELLQKLRKIESQDGVPTIIEITPWRCISILRAGETKDGIITYQIRFDIQKGLDGKHSPFPDFGWAVPISINTKTGVIQEGSIVASTPKNDQVARYKNDLDTFIKNYFPESKRWITGVENVHQIGKKVLEYPGGKISNLGTRMDDGKERSIFLIEAEKVIDGKQAKFQLQFERRNDPEGWKIYVGALSGGTDSGAEKSKMTQEILKDAFQAVMKNSTLTQKKEIFGLDGVISSITSRGSGIIEYFRMRWTRPEYHYHSLQEILENFKF